MLDYPLSTTRKTLKGKILRIYRVPALVQRTLPEIFASVFLSRCVCNLSLYHEFFGGDLVYTIIVFRLINRVRQRIFALLTLLVLRVAWL